MNGWMRSFVMLSLPDLFFALCLFRPPWRSWKLRRRIWKSERETEWTKFGSKWLRWNGRQWVASFLCASAPFCWYYLVPGPTIISLNSSQDSSIHVKWSVMMIGAFVKPLEKLPTIPQVTSYMMPTTIKNNEQGSNVRQSVLNKERLLFGKKPHMNQ